ncbi:MAG: hypothetical protein GTO16_05060 [Candidatus Aminicenantes bacterium]|nr:hypothetical protein [Candidatus Aminicenantes bacterium]
MLKLKELMLSKVLNLNWEDSPLLEIGEVAPLGTSRIRRLIQSASMA